MRMDAGQYAKPAYRRAEAPLAVPLLGADESYLKRMQARLDLPGKVPSLF